MAVSIAQKVQKFLVGRCAEMPAWAGVGKLARESSSPGMGYGMVPYDDTTLFYYLDRFCKAERRDILALFQGSVDALAKQTRDTPVRLTENIGMLAACSRSPLPGAR